MSWLISKKTHKDREFWHSAADTKKKTGTGCQKNKGGAVGLAWGLQRVLSADATKPCLEGYIPTLNANNNAAGTQKQKAKKT